jgi:outer membrane protein assembly factor BamB
VVAAYDLLSGRELWTHSWPARYRDPTGDGPRATPTWHDGLVYALGATGEFHVLDAATGKLVWSKNVLADAGAENVTWGVSNSPLIVDDQVIVTAGRGGHSLLAYHKKTGRRLWSALEDQAAYCSPMLVTLAGVRQIILVTALRALGVRPEDGQLLWDYPWRTQYDVNSAQPIVVSSHQVLVSSAYDHGSVLLEITANDKGLTAKPVWENKNLKNRFNSSVLHNGSIYGFDEGIFACIDARSGERKWKGGRYGYGQALLLGEHVLVLSEAGELVLLKASPDAPQEVARFVALEGKTWNHPAVSGGILLVRNAREMAAFRIAP